MHPPIIPSASPFALADDCSSLSPTFCSSLDPCSSHGFSSLQSPSAFPSFDSSTQDGCASHSNLNTLSSELPCFHHADFQKHVYPFHSSPKKTPSRCCEALQQDLGLDCIPEGSSLLESISSEHSISLPSSPSLPWEDTECSAFSPIQDGSKEKELPMFREFEPQFLSSPEPREHADLPHIHNCNTDGGYALYRQSSQNHQFEPFKTGGKFDDAACIDSQNTNRCYQTACTMPFEVASSVLTSLSHSVPGLITRRGHADDKENLTGHIKSSREGGVQLLDNIAPLHSLESKLDCKREGQKEALQDAHENIKKIMHFPCKREMFLDVVDEESKENVRPHVSEQVHKRIGRPKVDSNGWMCPKDAKKNFKPKPRQLMLDRWLTRQR